MGLGDRMTRWTKRPARRPKGGTASHEVFVPEAPPPAPGPQPPSPAAAFADAKVAPPRPLVWVGTSASGAAVWSSPVANGVGQKLWTELRAAAAAADAWPVLTGPAVLPYSWHLDEGRDPAQTVIPDAQQLLETAAAAAEPAQPGFRTRLEPTPDAVVEASLAAGYLALVTGVDGWQVPLAIGFEGLGGWSAAEHTAVLRHWEQQYRAEMVSLTDDGVGLVVGRPPSSHEAAMTAAEEIHAYCPDVVERGLGSMWALATTMAVSTAWSLRWST